MQKLKAVLVDDELEALDSLEILLGDYGNVQILKKVDNPLEVFATISTLKPNLIFLDINMPRINGVEILEEIRKFNPSLIIVIVSAHKNHLESIIKFNVFSYLQKPVNRMELKKTIENIQNFANEINGNPQDEILINSRKETVLIHPNEIDYIKADGQYSYIYLNTGKMICASYNIGCLMKKFPTSQFLKVNRSVLVNKDRLLSINRKDKICQIKTDHAESTVDISTTFIKEFYSQYEND